MNTQKVVFRLKRYWRTNTGFIDLYEAIKNEFKQIEYRDATWYWAVRLLKEPVKVMAPLDCYTEIEDFTEFLKVKRAWFTVGMPKNNLPRLEADITKLEYDPSVKQFRTHFNNVVEVAVKEH